MDNLINHSPITPESVLAEVKAMLQETSLKFEQEMKQKDENIEKQYQAWLKTWHKSLEPIKEMIGGMGNSNGKHAEEFFYNALCKGKKNILGEKFDDVLRKSEVTFNKGYEDEYDILLVNGNAVCIVEVKYKADGSDLPQKVLRKAQTFRVNFPKYNDKSIYLAVAGMSFHPHTEKACKDNGIAIIKQVGDTMIVTGENLKRF